MSCVYYMCPDTAHTSTTLSDQFRNSIVKYRRIDESLTYL